MKTRLFFFVFILTCLFSVCSLSAQNYYVSTSGLDTNPGTEALPWKTISKAASTLTAGQTAYVRGGTYNEKVSVSNSGTPGNYITFAAYPNEKPIIEGAGTGTGSWALFSLGSNCYIKVSGLKLQNGGMGIVSSGDNVIIENNYIYNFNNPAISLGNCTNSVIKGNIVERACYTSWGECITMAQCEYIDVCYNEVKNGSSTNTAGEGIDVKGSKHVRVFNNTVHDLPKKLAIYIDAYDGLDYDIQVFNNKIYNCTNGIVISSEKWNDMEKVWVYNNLIYDMSTGEGIKVVDYFNTNYRIKNIIIENNTMYGCKGISLDAPNGSDFIIRNNIIANCSSSISFPAAPTNLNIANNLVFPGTSPGTGGILADPQFTNPATKDFTLKASSPAIDKGVTNNIPFDYNFMKRSVGSATDIGAFENGSSELVQLQSFQKPTFSLAKSTVNQSTDDGTQNTSTGIVTLNATSLTTSCSSTTNKNLTALRFTNVTVPKGATIIDARIKVKLAAATTFNAEPIRINAERTANSQTFTTTANNISSKARTTNAAYWIPGTIAVGSLIETPCLDFVVGELVSDANWTSGNAMTFIFEFVAGVGRSLQFNAFDRGSGAAELSIEYTLETPNSISTINQSENTVKIFPNPATDFVTIDLQGNNCHQLSVYDSLGMNVVTNKIELNTNLLSYDVSNWNKGVYFVKVLDKQKMLTGKIIVN